MKDWPPDWEPVPNEAERDSLLKELRLEIVPGHVLYGRGCETLGRSMASDDVIFRLSDGAIAEVHLTWKGGPEPDPQWPIARIFSSFDEWFQDASNCDAL